MANTPILLTLMLSILLTFTSIIIPSFSCPIHQKQALLHFKSTLTSIYNSKYPVKFAGLHSWNSTSDCCYWKRVTCSRTGSVTELQLSNVTFPPPSYDQVPLSSDILTPLFHIRSLERLDISFNYFEGEIPGDGFGNLTKLLHLEMWRNYFNGPEPGSFRKLTTLKLSGNRFQGPIPAQLFALEYLQHLDLSNNKLGGGISPEIGEIPGDGFGNLTKLLHLDMSWNNFNGSIPSQLFQLTNLRYLDMSANSLEGKLGPELGSFRKLTTLRLYDNRFQGPIPAQLFELESLQYLDLRYNKLGGGISPEIGKLRNL
ncbi:leucine-rich repeat-containing protein [Tanacetum coccineum]